MKHSRWTGPRRAISFVLAVSLAGSGAAQNLPDLGDASQSALSPQNERRLGELIMRDLRRDPAFLDDPEITDYVETVGQRLVAVSAETRADFDFFVVRDSMINAFAMPGGFVGVHSGLILAAQSESELAGVMAHEVAHVTQRHIARQVDKQSQMTWPLLAGMLIALLAARSNPQAAQAAIVGTQAGAIQMFLNYSRDFEREADRVGFQLLEQAGYDVNGMPAFFDRLQRATRLAENNAPAYLRTHPLTTERMADLQNRAATARYRQRPDSIEFQLVRAKLRAANGSTQDAVKLFESQLREKRFATEAAARYGLAQALVRARDWKRADQELALARRVGGAHPMFETLGATIKTGMGQAQAARDQLGAALRDLGGRNYVRYAYAESLQSLGQNREAVGVLDELVKLRPRDGRAYSMLAKSHAALGGRALQHRYLAEYYALEGALPAAIEQLQLARTAPDADFYLQSVADARMRELRALFEEEKKQRGNQPR